jgi:FkbM family methyltransferase
VRRVLASPRIRTLREPWRRRYAVRRRVLLWRLRRAAPLERGVALERLGSAYGGWTIPRGAVGPESVCFCAGAGIDVSFDVALAERLGCRVVTIDPTQEAAEHFARVAGHVARARFVPVAAWSADGELEMFTAADPTHRTLSSDDLQATGRSVTVPCRTLPSLMRELGHARVDLLKLDVEGAEYELLDQVDELGVSVLCVEMHPTRGVRAGERAFRALHAAGFRLVAETDGDFTFRRAPARHESEPHAR